MEQIYIRRQGDKEQISKHLANMKQYSDKKLIKRYNSSVKTGIVGVHAQGLYLLAMRIEFLRRFDKSPVRFEDNCVIGLSGEIENT